MNPRLTLTSIVFSVLALSACVISPPMVETVESPTPGKCEAAFAELVDATDADRDDLVRATLDDCFLESWHQQNATLQPDLPVERVSDPQEQLAKLCADERWESTKVCKEAAAQS